MPVRKDKKILIKTNINNNKRRNVCEGSLDGFKSLEHQYTSAVLKSELRQQRHRVDGGAAHRTVTQQEAEGGSEPDRILHEGRGQGQPANPGFSSLH